MSKVDYEKERIDLIENMKKSIDKDLLDDIEYAYHFKKRTVKHNYPLNISLTGTTNAE